MGKQICLPKIAIAPSMLASDYARMGEEIRAMEAAGADVIHWDIMDGAYVPNLSFGPDIVKRMRSLCDLPFDVHLMVRDPGALVETFAKAGADMLTFHPDTVEDPAALAERITACGMLPAAALKPAIPAETVLPYLSKLHMVLVMTVEPGFGGQSFRAEQCEKVAAIRAYAQSHDLPLRIQVDGGINSKTAAQVARAGADVLVAGTALFRQDDYRQAVAQMRASALSAHKEG